jgi:AI-2 transport protein TqsA
MLATETQRTGIYMLFSAACLVVVVFGMRWAAPILVPFALALFLAVLSLPLLFFLAKNRVPGVLAILVTLMVNVAVVGGLIYIITHSLNELIVAAPRYIAQGQEAIIAMLARFEGWGVVVSQQMVTDLVDPQRVVDFAGGILRGLANMLTNAFLVLLIMIFILGEALIFPGKIRAIMGYQDTDLGRYTKIVREVQIYLGFKTLISLVTGGLIAGWTHLMGLDFPLFWGLLAFLLNYVPSIGSIIAAVPAVLLAMVQLGLGPALIVAAGYLVVNILMGNIVEPNVLGRTLGLSTLVVVLSLVFWGWLWGPVGMLLSVPLTMVVKIMLENTTDLRWVAVLLAGQAPPRGAAVVAGEGDAGPAGPA